MHMLCVLFLSSVVSCGVQRDGKRHTERRKEERKEKETADGVKRDKKNGECERYAECGIQKHYMQKGCWNYSSTHIPH